MRLSALLGVAAAWLFLPASAQEGSSNSESQPQPAADPVDIGSEPPADTVDTDSQPPVAPPVSPPSVSPPVPPPVSPPVPPPPAPAPKPTRPPVVTAAEEKRRLSADENGLTLYQAAGNGDLDGVKAALLAGAPVNWVLEHTGWSVLDVVCMTPNHQNEEAIVALLLQNGADPDIKDNRGRTSLFFAVSDGAPEGVIKELLKHVKNLNPTETQGVTALNVAARKGYVKAAELLLAAGADPHQGDSFGGSAMHEAKNSKNNELRIAFNLTAIPEARRASEL